MKKLTEYGYIFMLTGSKGSKQASATTEPYVKRKTGRRKKTNKKRKGRESGKGKGGVACMH